MIVSILTSFVLEWRKSLYNFLNLLIDLVGCVANMTSYCVLPALHPSNTRLNLLGNSDSIFDSTRLVIRSFYFISVWYEIESNRDKRLKTGFTTTENGCNPLATKSIYP